MRILLILASLAASLIFAPAASAACTGTGASIKCDTVSDIFADYQSRWTLAATPATLPGSAGEWPAAYGHLMELGYHVGDGPSGPIMMEHTLIPSAFGSGSGVSYILGASEYSTSILGTWTYWSEVVTGAMNIYGSLDFVSLDVFVIDGGVDYGLQSYSQTFTQSLVLLNQIPYQTVPAPVSVPGPEAGAGLASLALLAGFGFIKRRKKLIA